MYLCGTTAHLTSQGLGGRAEIQGRCVVGADQYKHDGRGVDPHVRVLLDRMQANDWGWFQNRWRAGALSWLEAAIGAASYKQLGSRVKQGDMAWLRAELAVADWQAASVPPNLGSIRGHRRSRRPRWLSRSVT